MEEYETDILRYMFEDLRDAYTTFIEQPEDKPCRWENNIKMGAKEVCISVSAGLHRLRIQSSGDVKRNGLSDSTKGKEFFDNIRDC